MHGLWGGVGGYLWGGEGILEVGGKGGRLGGVQKVTMAREGGVGRGGRRTGEIPIDGARGVTSTRGSIRFVEWVGTVLRRVCLIKLHDRSTSVLAGLSTHKRCLLFVCSTHWTFEGGEKSDGNR